MWLSDWWLHYWVSSHHYLIDDCSWWALLKNLIALLGELSSRTWLHCWKMLVSSHEEHHCDYLIDDCSVGWALMKNFTAFWNFSLVHCAYITRLCYTYKSMYVCGAEWKHCRPLYCHNVRCSVISRLAISYLKNLWHVAALHQHIVDKLYVAKWRFHGDCPR